jgi:hypothetical protein
MPNMLKELAPQYSKYGDAIKVFDIKGAKPKMAADIISQKIIFYFT